ncbi:MAG: YkgJ family cysteine cluster protein [Candidatus Helarchaeota archaeon]
MTRDISYYCVKYHCGKCCERGWDIFVSENDIKMWEQKRPDILDQITIKVVDGKEKKILKKRTVKCPDGKNRDLCIYYDFEKKCQIHDVNPEICRNFSCLRHTYFIFQLFNKISQLIEEFGPKEK